MGKGSSHAASVALIYVGGLFRYMTEPEIQCFAFLISFPCSLPGIIAAPSHYPSSTKQSGDGGKVLQPVFPHRTFTSQRITLC